MPRMIQGTYQNWSQWAKIKEKSESNLISKCHKGAQLHREISKIMNSDTGTRLKAYVSE